MLYVRVLIQIGTGYCILDPPPIIVWGDWLCCGSTFQLLVWERMHLWGNWGFGLCVMSSSVYVWVVYDDG